MLVEVSLNPGEVVGVGSWMFGKFLTGTELWAVANNSERSGYLCLVVTEESEAIRFDTRSIASLGGFHELTFSTDGYISGAAFLENVGSCQIDVLGTLGPEDPDWIEFAPPTIVEQADFYRQPSGNVPTLNPHLENDKSIQDILKDISLEIDLQTGRGTDSSTYSVALIAQRILQLPELTTDLISESWVAGDSDGSHFFLMLEYMSQKSRCQKVGVAGSSSWLADSAYCGCKVCAYRYVLRNHPLFDAEVRTLFGPIPKVILAFEVPQPFVEPLRRLEREYGFSYDDYHIREYVMMAALEREDSDRMAKASAGAATSSVWDLVDDEMDDEFFDEEVLAHERTDPDHQIDFYHDDEAEDVWDWYENRSDY